MENTIPAAMLFALVIPGGPGRAQPAGRWARHPGRPGSGPPSAAVMFLFCARERGRVSPARTDDGAGVSPGRARTVAARPRLHRGGRLSNRARTLSSPAGERPMFNTASDV